MINADRLTNDNGKYRGYRLSSNGNRLRNGGCGIMIIICLPPRTSVTSGDRGSHSRTRVTVRFSVIGLS